MTDPARAAYAYVGAFVEELARSGVRHVCIAPGSRSTPLALTIANHSSLRTWMHVDERSAAFFALGLARGLDEPVALLCTSGTAATNFFPAIVEARSAGVPLIVLTADRPPELRDVGAPQTIDQNRLFGAHVKWFVEVALPEATTDLLRYARTLAARATATAVAIPAGPVHLNFPLREPLVPVAADIPADLTPADALAWNGRPDGEPWVKVTRSRPSVDRVAAKGIAAKLNQSQRPMIVCGPQPDRSLAPALALLAHTIRAPLLADPLSQVRWGGHERGSLIDRYDSILRNESTADALAPDFILRIGGVPTSKALLQFFHRHGAVPQVVIDDARWPDPTLSATEMVHADPRQVCEDVLDVLASNGAARSRSSDWMDQWHEINSLASEALERYTCALGEPFEGTALADVVATLPEGATLFVSSSMPVRDLDAFGAGDARSIRVLANRGANGIDGVVSTALGAAAAASVNSGGPLVLVIGDLALYHDMNGLLAAKLHAIDATIVLLNNDGGGIFSFLPQATNENHFEQLFGTPHGLQFEPVASLYGGTYLRAHDSASLRRGIADGIARRGLHLIELRTDRARNVILHREAWSAVAEAVGTA
jgi:2-succinyl-5-enolpyruvyl-6-hydroxy-3-cyclohexene-1-carboxylate synthase